MRIGPVAQVRMLYDRMDRSTGTAFVTYEDSRDARDAMREYDGANANGQPIKLTLVPTAPAPAPAAKRSLFDRIDPAPRSLFDRIDNGPASRADSREDTRRRRRNRSDSPRRTNVDKPAPENVDRYVPGGRARDSRSPVRRRGTPREGGRRPGQRREDSGRGGRRGGRTDDDGHRIVGGRPRKTAEELDAEMADYFNKGEEAPKSNGMAPATQNGFAHTAGVSGDDDIDMIE